MSNVYHVNPDTGRANICRAETPEGCPLKTSDGTRAFHANDKEEARQHGLSLLENKYGKLGATAKKGGGTNESPKSSVEKLEQEIAELRKLKINTEDPVEIKRINGAIRGKSIHVSKAKNAAKEMKATTEAFKAYADNKPSAKKAKPGVDDSDEETAKTDQRKNVSTAPIQRPKVEDIPYSTIRVMKKFKKVSDLPKIVVEQPEVDPTAAKILDKNINIFDKKELLKDYLSDKKNYDEAKKIFKENGYSIEDSNIINGLMSDESGSNITYRSAIRESELSGDTRVADILMRIEDADFENGVVLTKDRFTAYDPNAAAKSDEERDLDDEIDEAPDFLKDDPDFVIEDEDFEEDEKI